MYSCEKLYVISVGRHFTLEFSQHTNVSIQVRSHVYVINVGRHLVRQIVSQDTHVSTLWEAL